MVRPNVVNDCMADWPLKAQFELVDVLLEKEVLQVRSR